MKAKKHAKQVVKNCKEKYCAECSHFERIEEDRGICRLSEHRFGVEVHPCETCVNWEYAIHRCCGCDYIPTCFPYFMKKGIL